MEATQVTVNRIRELIENKAVEQLTNEIKETVHTLVTLFERIEDIAKDKKELLMFGGIAVVGCIVSAESPDAIMTIGLPEDVDLALNTLLERQVEISKK